MCNNNDTTNNDCRCIAEILTVICILQQNANCKADTCLDTCDRGFLGCGISTPLSCNTRPVMLYTCCGNGTPWSMPTTKENVDLAPNPDTTDLTSPYVATNSFFTMNLNCVCALRCLNDTFVCI